MLLRLRRGLTLWLRLRLRLRRCLPLLLLRRGLLRLRLRRHLALGLRRRLLLRSDLPLRLLLWLSLLRRGLRTRRRGMAFLLLRRRPLRRRGRLRLLRRFGPRLLCLRRLRHLGLRCSLLPRGVGGPRLRLRCGLGLRRLVAPALLRRRQRRSGLLLTKLRTSLAGRLRPGLRRG